MAAGFEYFTSADVGAPVLNGAAGRLIAVLDWALVTKGGWAKPFTGTNLAAYRSGTGNRFYLRVDDTQTTYSRLRAYRAMTAVSTGTSQFPTNTQATNINTWGVRKAVSAGSDPRRYWGVRTNQFFVMIIEPTTDSLEVYSDRTIISFGDIPSLAQADSHNSIMLGQYGVDAGPITLEYCFSTGIGATVNPSASNVLAAMSGSPNGTVVAPLTQACLPYIQGASSTAAAAVAVSGQLTFGPILCTTANSATSATNGMYLRARLPNVHHIWGAIPNALTSGYATYNEELVSIGSRDFIVLPQSTSSIYPGSYISPGLLLEITDTDGAL